MAFISFLPIAILLLTSFSSSSFSPASSASVYLVEDKGKNVDEREREEKRERKKNPICALKVSGHLFKILTWDIYRVGHSYLTVKEYKLLGKSNAKWGTRTHVQRPRASFGLFLKYWQCLLFLSFMKISRILTTPVGFKRARGSGKIECRTIAIPTTDLEEQSVYVGKGGSMMRYAREEFCPHLFYITKKRSVAENWK